MAESHRRSNPASDNELVVTRKIRIPMSEFDFTYARSSGPGGQNVNKVETKAQLRWDVRSTSSLPDPVRERFLQRFDNRITGEGELLVSSQRYRSQSRNVQDCLDKVREMVRQVVQPPKRRKRTRPSRGAVERRLQKKRERKQKKQRRRKPRFDD